MGRLILHFWRWPARPRGAGDRGASGPRPSWFAALAPASAADTAVRCTADGAACIRLASYIPDVCGAIETAARRNGLDPAFFVRLIWKESLFDAAAVSPAGALGIAQFMPGTAQLRGLDDPFNPAEALRSAALYLADLSRGYGNIGLAAVAYNGGEARAERFIADEGGLPAETRAYVQAITGHSAEAWRDAPPAKVDLALAGEAGFQAACVAQAADRTLREFRSAPQLRPWAVIVASNRDRDGAERQAGRLRNRFAAVLAGEDGELRLRPRPRHGRAGSTWRRSAATAAPRPTPSAAGCGRSGGDCMVLRN